MNLACYISLHVRHKPFELLIILPSLNEMLSKAFYKGVEIKFYSICVIRKQQA